MVVPAPKKMIKKWWLSEGKSSSIFYWLASGRNHVGVRLFHTFSDVRMMIFLMDIATWLWIKNPGILSFQSNWLVANHIASWVFTPALDHNFCFLVQNLWFFESPVISQFSEKYSFSGAILMAGISMRDFKVVMAARWHLFGVHGQDLLVG